MGVLVGEREGGVEMVAREEAVAVGEEEGAKGEEEGEGEPLEVCVGWTFV